MLPIITLDVNNEEIVENYEFNELNNWVIIVSDYAVNKFLTNKYDKETVYLDFGKIKERYDVITYGVISSEIYLTRHEEEN